MLPKIRRHFMNKSCSMLNLSKNVFYKKCGLNWYSSMKNFFWKIQTFFMIFEATVPSQRYRYQINILQHLIFFIKMKLVSTVWVSTSLSKSGYPQGPRFSDFPTVLKVSRVKQDKPLSWHQRTLAKKAQRIFGSRQIGSYIFLFFLTRRDSFVLFKL